MEGSWIRQNSGAKPEMAEVLLLGPMRLRHSAGARAGTKQWPTRLLRGYGQRHYIDAMVIRTT